MNSAHFSGRSLGMIIHERESPNLEFPFDQLAGRLTAVDAFYISDPESL